MATPCPPGWAHDPLQWRSTACPVSNSVLAVTTGFACVAVFLMLAVLTFVLVAGGSTMEKVARIQFQAAVCGMLLVAPMSVVLATDPTRMPSMPAWIRVSSTVGFFVVMSVAAPLTRWRASMVAITFVHALNPARRRVMARRVNYVTAISEATICFAAGGWAVCLFGATAGAQDSGAAVFLSGMTALAYTGGAMYGYIYHELTRLLREIGSASRSAAQIREVCQLARRMVGICAVLVVLVTPLVFFESIRGIAFMVFMWPFSVVMTFGTVPSIARLELSRMGLFRGGRAKVHSHGVRFGHASIADFAASASNELLVAVSASTSTLGEDNTEASDATPKNGVSLRFMRGFADEAAVDDRLTAGDVCARHVKPMTRRARTSLVTLLQEGRDDTGALWCDAPSQFISYAWSYPFRLLVDIVEQFEEENPPPSGTTYYYFLDQFSLNQHVFVDEQANQKQMQQQIVATLEGNMTRSGHVLMCLHPWSRPVPLRRAWCLFELFVAMQSQCKVTMCFGHEDADALNTAVANGNYSAEQAVGEIDAAGAGATKSSDKELIMALIAEKVGVDRFNSQMKQYLMTAMKGTVTAVLARNRDRKRSLPEPEGWPPAHRSSVSSVPSVAVAAAAPGDRECAFGDGNRDLARGSAVAEHGTSGAIGQLVAEVHTAAMRTSALEAQVGSRMSALEAQVGTRMSALEAQVGALGGQVSSRMTVLEERVEVLVRAMSRLSDQSIVIGAGTAAE